MQRWGRGDESWRDAWGPDVAGWREPEGRHEGELVCFDAAYFFTERGEEVRELYQGRADRDAFYGPWSTVGRHLRWNATLEAEAKAAVRNVLGLSTRKMLPRFFTMHIRRGDFLDECLPDWPWFVRSALTTPLLFPADRRCLLPQPASRAVREPPSAPAGAAFLRRLRKRQHLAGRRHDG